MERLKAFPLAVLILAISVDVSPERAEIERTLETILQHHGILFKRLTRDLVPTTVSQMVVFGETPKLQLWTNGKLAFSHSLNMANNFVQDLKTYVQNQKKAIELKGLYQFKEIIANQLAIVLLYDSSIPKMSSFLDGLSIAFPRVKFGVVHCSVYVINNPNIIPIIHGYPSILIYSNGYLITKTPINVPDLCNFLWDRKDQFDSAHYVYDPIILARDFEGEEDLTADLSVLNDVLAQLAVPETSIPETMSPKNDSQFELTMEQGSAPKSRRKSCGITSTSGVPIRARSKSFAAHRTVQENSDSTLGAFSSKNSLSSQNGGLPKIPNRRTSLMLSEVSEDCDLAGFSGGFSGKKTPNRSMTTSNAFKQITKRDYSAPRRSFTGDGESCIDGGNETLSDLPKLVSNEIPRKLEPKKKEKLLPFIFK